MIKRRICGIAKVTQVSGVFDAGKKAEVKMRTDGRDVRVEWDVDGLDIKEFRPGDEFLVLIVPYEKLFDGVETCAVSVLPPPDEAA